MAGAFLAVYHIKVLKALASPLCTDISTLCPQDALVTDLLALVVCVCVGMYALCTILNQVIVYVFTVLPFHILSDILFLVCCMWIMTPTNSKV